MPRGRHRHSPPLHRLLPPSAIAGVSLVCALGPWVFTEPLVLRVLAAAAAVTAIVGAVVMRRWDIQAGKQVADLTRARAGDEWRFEERVAELESDLDESRELRVKLEQRLRAKRTELAGLRNEHAALLRRYATAETERASALEGRRLLEIESTTPSRALPPARAAEEASEAETGAVATREATTADTAETEAPKGEAPETDLAEAEAATADTETAEDEPKAPAAFSPEGSQLYLRAQAALARFDVDAAKPAKPVKPVKSDEPAEAEPAQAAPAQADGDAEAAQEDEAKGKPEAVDEHTRAAAPHTATEENETPAQQATPEEATARTEDAESTHAGQTPEAPEGTRAPEAEADRAPEASEAARSAGASQPAEPTAAETGTLVPRPAAPVQRPSGHFTVPTAVAVVPAAQPVRPPAAEGGFDFFGTKQSSASDALEAVQNEDLADVVGEEALALHKAESEAEFKPADEQARAVGQVIDLTAHDETEQIDLQSLRTAAS
ncbi:hypothetical protein ABZ614_10440 [Streptomyces sp. NPDC013178]|uniref:hypothetical protein n=1 Tax=Streptomyces sp. NPDC013178 TaxID=3155118 RepID=UPI0033E6BD2F